MSSIVTIGREFGSGGREVGLKVASALNIPFYDKEIIALIAEKGEISRDVLETYEENVSRTSFYMPYARNALFLSYSQPLTDKIFIQQYQAIQELAKQGPCVIVGRCADYALKDKSVNVFIHADMSCRIRRKLALNIGVAEKNMEKHIRSIDKKRKEYYSHYTDQLWGLAQNYNLCVDTSVVGTDGGADIILKFLKLYQGVQ